MTIQRGLDLERPTKDISKATTKREEQRDNIPPGKITTPITTAKSRQRSKRPRQLIEVMEAKLQGMTKSEVEGNIFAYSVEGNNTRQIMLAYKATEDPNTMHFHQAMKEKDRSEFIKAMQKDLQNQLSSGNFSTIKRSEVP